MSDRSIPLKPSLVTADRMPSSVWEFWLLPTLLLIQAIFIGATFDTLPAVLGAYFCALLITGMIVQWIGQGARVTPDRVSPERPPKSQGSAVGAQSERGSLISNDAAASRLARLRWWRGLVVIPTAVIAAGVMAALRVSHHLSGNLNPVAMIVDSIAHAAFLIGLTLLVFYPRRGHPAMLGCGLLLVLTTVTAGGVSHTINGQLVAALATVIGFAIAADHILGHWQTHNASRARRRLQKRIARRNGSGRRFAPLPLPTSTVTISESRGHSSLPFSVLALSILLMSTSAAGHLAGNIVPGLQFNLFDRLSQSLESVTSGSIIGGSRYVSGSRLGTIRRHMLGDPAERALSAYSTSAPGYLRGTVFDRYRDGAWKSVSARSYQRDTDASVLRPRTAIIEGSGQTPLRLPSSTELERFRLREKAGGSLAGTVEVHNVPLKGLLVFTSLSTEWIEASTYGVSISHHDMIITGVDTQEPYVLGINSEMPRETLESVRKDVLLHLDLRMRETIEPLARSICDGRLTARSKARAMEDYFQANYTYWLGKTATPKGVDPVVHFLKSQHPAHCEFFATAAALMLRSVGVPTRYVTGYVVKEKSDQGDYWMARNRDAHAWVEAYDEISQQWFPVEATVGRTYHTLMTEGEYADQQSNDAGGLQDSDEEGSYLSLLFGWLFSFRASDSLTFLFRIAQLPLFCIVAGLLWVRHRQKLRAGTDPMDYQSRQMLERVDRQLRKHALVRSPNETLHQFASRLESAAGETPDGSTVLEDAARWYRSFAAARYRGLMPQPIESSHWSPDEASF
jgi:transglutaminase-like putative cysteine protease